MTKVGLQFEQVLIAGLMNFAFRLPNGTPEFRYATHEATEECHHTQMFQEFVNRTGADVAGAPRFFRFLAPFLPLAAHTLPFGFFVGVLAGEEPIDHMQKSILRSRQRACTRCCSGSCRSTWPRRPGTSASPTSTSSTARRSSSFHQRFVLSLAFPIIMRWLCDAILKPSRQARQDMGMPRSVVKDVYWGTPQSRRTLRDLFADVRMLAETPG